MSDERLEIGYVAGAHGIDGRVEVRLFDPSSDVLSGRPRLVLVRRRSEGPAVVAGAYELRELSPIGGRAGRFRVALHGVTDRTAAEGLKGCSVEVDRAVLPPLGDDEYYLADAVGLPVERTLPSAARQRLGVVVGVTSNGPQDLFEVEWVDTDGRVRQWLLPVLPGFVLDVGPDRVLVDVPAGLLPDALEREP